MASIKINRKDLSFRQWRKIIKRQIKLFLRRTPIVNAKINWTQLGQYLGNIKGDKAKPLYQKYLNSQLLNHGNKGREPYNKTSKSKVKLFVDKYDAFLENVQEYLKSKTFIPALTDLNYEFMQEQKYSLSSMYRFLERFNKFNRNTTKKKRKQIRKRLRELAKSTIQVQQKNEVIIDDKNYQSSRNIAHYDFGEVVEIDATSIEFYNNQKIWAYAAIDAKTSALLAFWFELSENNFGYQMLLKELFGTYGLPKILFADNRKGIDPKDKNAIIAGLIKDLDIDLLTSSVSQDKPHVERAWRNGNSWLPTHFAKKQYKTLKQLQKNVTIIGSNYNKRYKYFPSKEKPGMFRKTHIDLSKFNLRQFTKTIQKGELIKIQKETYAPFVMENNLEKRASMTVGFQVVVHHNTKTNNFWIIANNKTYHLKKTSKFQSTTELVEMAKILTKLWAPRKIVDNPEISIKQKHIWANIAKQRDKLDLKEKHLNRVENELKNKLNELKKQGIKDV